MKVYEVIKDCSISYTGEGEDVGFVLYKGDFFFIEHDFCWVKKESRFNHESPYSKKSLLVKIYHNKLVWFGDKPEDRKYEWTWIENINLIDPLINGDVEPKYFDKANPFTGRPFCKDVTFQWSREEKLNELLTIEKN
jgi:hypothetical protein